MSNSRFILFSLSPSYKVMSCSTKFHNYFKYVIPLTRRNKIDLCLRQSQLCVISYVHICVSDVMACLDILSRSLVSQL